MSKELRYEFDNDRIKLTAICFHSAAPMMHLFLSYSHTDHHWVQLFWRELLSEGHLPWIDRDIPSAADWWETICESIERCECFIFIMSPKSVTSIYCLTELNYAIALNKPILPIMLTEATQPKVLSELRVQYQTVGERNIERVLIRVEQGLGEVRERRAKGKFRPREATRPEAPTPNSEDQLFETFLRAEEAAGEGKHLPAEQLFQQVINADPDGLGEAAKIRLKAVHQTRDRIAAYGRVVRLASNSLALEGARAAWVAYIDKYGADHDPENMVMKLSAEAQASGRGRSAVPAWNEGEVVSAVRSRLYHVLPQPFELQAVPSGPVTVYGAVEMLAAFQIAKYPLTNAQFGLFMRAGGYNEHKWWTAAGWRQREKEGWTEPRHWHDERWNKPNYPVVGVSWYEAVAYCLWLGAASGERVMLPTAPQWQRAAQGDDGRVFPWGNSWNGNRCTHSVEPYHSVTTTPVTFYGALGDSPFGVSDMAGNIWEWCRTAHKSGSNRVSGVEVRVLRGGSWGMLEPDFFRVTAHDWAGPERAETFRGFRVAVY